MPSAHRHPRAAALALSLLMGWLAIPAQAAERGITERGIAFVSGGVGETEQQALSEARSGYSFWLTTAAQGTGAFMANVQVRILDSRGQAVLDHMIDGPWLLVALPPGSYTLEATSKASNGNPPLTKKAAFTTTQGAQKRLTLSFGQPQ